MISSIVLKLFDLLFEKEFDYKITHILLLKYFDNYESSDTTEDLL